MDVNKKLSSLQEISKAELSKILTVNPLSKYVVLEPGIIRPLERVCGVKWLKANGVEKIFKLEETCPNFGNYPVFYMIFSKFVTFKQVVDQIRSQIDQENPMKNKFHVIVVPCYLFHFQEELEELGLYSIIKLHSLQWFPLHLDTGILSLELPCIYKSLFLQLDYKFLTPLSKALWKLFFVVGKPRFIVTLGEYSNKILSQIDLLIEDKGDSDRLESDFGSLIIIDRNMDYPSALLTPGTYSALLNEVYGVSTGICEYKEENGKEDGRLNPVVKKQPVNFTLDSNQDSVYADIKNRYFTEVTSVISALTKQLKTEKVHSKEMALDEIKRYVQTQLQATKSRKKFITNHLLAAETIINVLGPRYETQQEVEADILKNTNKSTNFSYLEESLCTEDDKFVSLRLFCLLCVTQKLNENEIKSFWRKFLHQFGYKYGLAYRYLINANFIPEASSTSGNLQAKIRLPKFVNREFYTNASKFKQIPPNPEKIDLKYPTCCSYVFGGSYIPLITQIASMLLNATPIDEIKTKLGGLGILNVRNDKGFPLQSRSVLIYLIGGATYAEIAACNLLETLTGAKIVVLSDRIVSGNDLMREMLS
ncbi:vacuolar protein sorting-associated protein 33B [Asbolus verrucosus]|uniref:Vacuolar protein sorting-associated protein 33B n=1 Tax=Asbolus verrucosus TaxID=1661398 RepID=A0A482VVX4_ASBVE|nr:vacuolar protein sorting-associated protein 33B [Asbolus verrucosus]